MLRPTLYNLGDAISRDGDPAAPALIDVGAPGGPRTWRSLGHLPAVVWQAQRTDGDQRAGPIRSRRSGELGTS